MKAQTPEIIKSKTGLIKLGENTITITATIKKYPGNPYYYVKYERDQSHECSKDFEEALRFFNRLAKSIN